MFTYRKRQENDCEIAEEEESDQRNTKYLT